MSPRYLRYRFPSEPGDASASPEQHARSLMHLFGAIPPHELSVGRLDAIAGQWAHDPGALEMAFGAAAGVPLSVWLRLVVGPGGRIAYLDVDLDEMGQAIARAKMAYRQAQ